MRYKINYFTELHYIQLPNYKKYIINKNHVDHLAYNQGKWYYTLKVQPREAILKAALNTTSEASL